MSRNTADGQRSPGTAARTTRTTAALPPSSVRLPSTCSSVCLPSRSRPRRRGLVLATALEWRRPNMCRPGSFPWSRGGSGGGRTKPAHGKED